MATAEDLAAVYEKMELAGCDPEMLHGATGLKRMTVDDKEYYVVGSSLLAW